MSNYRKTKLKREESLLEEAVDREGNWLREFTSRAIIWPMFEQWAAENRYRMIAMRNGRRLYQKGDRLSGLITYVEIRQTGSKVTLKGWIQAGWLSRLLCAWMIPSQVFVDPRGFWIVRYRRRLCHSLNALLAELKQPPILHSQSAHWGDLDMTTLTLAMSAMFLLSFFGFLSVQSISLNPMQLITIEGVEALVDSLGWPFGILSAVATFTVIAHKWFVVHRFPSLNWAKMLSLAVGCLVIFFSGMTVAKRAEHRLSERHALTHCVLSVQPEVCQETLAKLPPELRDDLQKKIKFLQSEIARSR